MINKSIFEFRDYKSLLREYAGPKSSKRGRKSALARAIGCQATYISQVLHGKAQLSLEQAERLCEFFGFNNEERQFLLTLVQMERAGTPSLRNHFKKEMNELLERRMILTKRLGPKTLITEEGRSRYYSSWIYSAVHIALTIPELQSREALTDFFQLPIRRINEVLDFLCSIGLAEPLGAGFRAGISQVRLGNDSHHIIKHHSNWRTQALHSLERERPTDLHYSAVVSLSHSDVLKIKNILLEALATTQAIVQAADEETLCGVVVDFFSLQQREN